MKNVLKIVLATLFYILLIETAYADVDYSTCPASKLYYQTYPDPSYPRYATAQEFNEKEFAALKAQWGPSYTFSVAPGSYPERANIIYYIYDRSGSPVGYKQLLGVKVPTCPDGFQTNDYGSCSNAITKTCDCPVGQKFKPSANMCITITPTSPEADPDNDNGPNCPAGEGEPQQPVCGNPINPGSGNKIQIEKDYADKNGSLSIVRIYNSSPNSINKTAGKFGANWSFAYDSKITTTAFRPTMQCYLWADDNSKFCQAGVPPTSQDSSTKVVAIMRGDGKKAYFTRNTSSSNNDILIKDANINASMTYDPAGNAAVGPIYTYISSSGLSRELYADFGGRLIAIIDQNGTSRSITNFWSSNESNVGRWPNYAPICNHAQDGPMIYGDRPLCVTDNWGRQINFEYESVPGTGTSNNPQVRITKVLDPAGQVYIYAYDGPSAGCDIPGGTSAACHANNLTSITYPDGHRRIYYYNEIAQINGGNDCNSPNLSVGNGFGSLLNSLTGITDENGVRFATWSYDCSGRATSSQHAGGAERVDISYAETSNSGNATRTVTHYTGDPASPTATSRTYTYKLVSGIPVVTATDKPCIDCDNVATRSYDANGNTTEYTDWNGNKTTFVFDLNRNLETSRVEGAGTANARTISTTWHATFRLPLKIAEPKRITTLTYDANGNLLTRMVQTTTDQSGASAFNATPTGKARIWTYTYNDVGQISTITGPRSDVADVTKFAYDASGNLISITNALNQVTTFSGYDANRNVGQITEPNGTNINMTYTPRGWLNSRTVFADGLSETTTYSYDGVGQLTTVVNADGTNINYTYDGAHRLSSITDTKGNRIAYTYDAMSNRIAESVTDPQNVLRRQITRSYDILNNLQQVTGAAR